MYLRCYLLVGLLVISSTSAPAISLNALPRLTARDTITGTLFGRVLNATQEGFPGVRVRVTNLETGNTRATQTDSTGRYRIAFVPLGLYSIEAIKDGFEVSRPSRQPIMVQLNRQVEAVPDMILAPVVLAVAPPVAPPTPVPAAGTFSSGRLVNRFDAARRFNLDERQLAELPLGRIRSFDDLALLSPGVAPPPEVKGTVGPGVGGGIGSGGQFAVNGQRGRSNNFTVDGSDNNDEDIGVRRQGFVSLIPQSIESVREVQIVTQLWDSELGRNLGSQVNAVTRGGGNQIHGTLYEFFSHHNLNAREFFDYKSDGVSRPLLATAVDGFVDGRPVNETTIPVLLRRTPLGPGTPVLIQNPSGGENSFQRQQYGATLGFPIKRDRSFIFASFERQQLIDAQETHFSVPTIAQRGFLGLGATGFITTDGAGEQRVFTPTFVAGDAVFSLFPFPNNPVGPYGDNTFTQILQAGGTGTNFSARFDQTLKDSARGTSHILTGRYNFTDDARTVPSVGGAIYSSVRPHTATHNLSLFLNSQFNPRFSNQLRGSFGRSHLKFTEVRDPSLAASRLAPGNDFLLNRGMLFNGSDPRLPPTAVDYFERSAAEDSAEDHLGPVGQVTISPFSPLGADVELFPQARANNTYQLADTAVVFRGRHNLKFGFDLRRTQLNSVLNRNYRPKISFGGTPDLTGATLFDPVFQQNLSLVRGLSQFGPTPGFFSGTDLAALGLPTGILQSLAQAPEADSTIGLRFWQYDFFATDQFRFSSGFSVTFGVRYQYNTVPEDARSRIERTFGPAQNPDSTVSICKPFTHCGEVFPNADLIAGYNATLNSLRQIIGGRTSIYEPDRNNFAPQVGFAIDPLMRTRFAGKTALRGGFSFNYDPALGNVVSQSRNVYPNFVPLNVDANTFSYAPQVFFIPGQTGTFAVFNPKFLPVELLTNAGIQSYGLIASQRLNAIGVPRNAFPQLSGLLFSPPPVRLAGAEFPSGGGLAFTLPARNLRSPYALQFNLQFEREFKGQVLINVAYVGNRGLKLTRFRTPNGGINSLTLPIDPLGLTLFRPGVGVPAAVSIPPLGLLNGRSDVGRLDPTLGAYTIFDSSASSSYHALQASVNKNYSRGFQLSAAYTWSHAIDEVSDVFDVGGAFVLPQDDRNLRSERASANFDLRHRFVASVVSELPILRRFNATQGAAGAVLGGWQLAAISTHQSGQPFTVNSSLDINFDGNLTDRLNTTRGLSAAESARVRLGLMAGIDSSGLLAPLGTNGAIGRNTFRSGSMHETNIALRKQIRLRNEHALSFRCEVFNVLNRPQFGIPVRILEAPSFGRAVDTRRNPRQIQFAVKYSF